MHADRYPSPFPLAAAFFLLLGLSCFCALLRAEKVEEVPNPRQLSGSFVADGGGGASKHW